MTGAEIRSQSRDQTRIMTWPNIYTEESRVNWSSACPRLAGKLLINQKFSQKFTERGTERERACWHLERCTAFDRSDSTPLLLFGKSYHFDTNTNTHRSPPSPSSCSSGVYLRISCPSFSPRGPGFDSVTWSRLTHVIPVYLDSPTLCTRQQPQHVYQLKSLKQERFRHRLLKVSSQK